MELLCKTHRVMKFVKTVRINGEKWRIYRCEQCLTVRRGQ